MNDNTKLYLIALYFISGVGDRTISILIDHYNSVENVFLDDEDSIVNALKTLINRNRNKTYNFTKTQLLDKAACIIEDSQKRGIDIVSIFDEDYPFNLRQIDNPPYILYMKGNKKMLRRNAVSIVGTRDAQKSSMDYAFELASGLSAMNITVVSGFAKGIDTAAHLGALSAGCNTIAVFGCGLERIYPAENTRMYNKMIEHSLIVSEFAVGSIPDRGNFPRRNRIISGLSYATVMVEAAERSGALITTNFALEHGRDVFIAPYDETKRNFMGNHKLYKDGARIANSYIDIIADLDNILSADSDYIKMKNRHFNGGIINSNNPTVESNNNNVRAKNIKTIAPKQSVEKNIEKPVEVEIEPLKQEIDYSSFNDNEKLVLDIISKKHDVHIDNIAEHVNLAMGELAMILMQLEIKGVIRQNPGKSYVLEK